MKIMLIDLSASMLFHILKACLFQLTLSVLKNLLCFVSSGNLLRLSEQNLIDCVSDCHGCGDGMPESAFKYVINSQGSKFALESDYPYAGHDQDCQFDSTSVTHVSTVKMYSKEADIQTILLLKNGPVSVLIDVTVFGSMLYKGGIYEGKDCALFQNHTATVVGYGIEDDKPFWIVRNSFGTEWVKMDI